MGPIYNMYGERNKCFQWSNVAAALIRPFFAQKKRMVSLLDLPTIGAGETAARFWLPLDL